MNYTKYVDDTTVLSISADPGNSDLQLSADNLVVWTEKNRMRVNESKTKEMLIYFGRKHNPVSISRTYINSKEIERVESFKLLGVVLSSDLSWSEHVDYMLKKVAKRMYCVHYLVRARVKDTDIFNYLLFYYSVCFGIRLPSMASWPHTKTIRRN